MTSLRAPQVPISLDPWRVGQRVVIAGTVYRIDNLWLREQTLDGDVVDAVEINLRLVEAEGDQNDVTLVADRGFPRYFVVGGEAYIIHHHEQNHNTGSKQVVNVQLTRASWKDSAT